MQDQKLLLCARTGDELIAIGTALRLEGFTVLPSRTHELGVDALARTVPDTVLVHVEHEAATSIAFARLAEATGVRVLLFTFGITSFDPAALLPHPVVECDGDANDLAELLAERLRARGPGDREQA